MDGNNWNQQSNVPPPESQGQPQGTPPSWSGQTSPPGQGNSYPRTPLVQTGKPFPSPVTGSFPVEPMEELPLEPLSSGEIIDRALAILKGNYKPFVHVSLLLYGPVMVLIIIYMVTVLASMGARNDPTVACIVMVVAMLMMVGSIILFFVMTGMVVKMTSEYILGNRLTVRQAWEAFKEQVWTLVGAMFLIWLFISLIAGAGGFGAAVLFALNNIGTSILAVLIIIATIIAVVYLSFCYTMVPEVVIIENLGGMEALNRSRELFQYSWDTVSKVMVIPFLNNLLVQLVAGFPYIGVILALFVYPLMFITPTVMYYDIIVSAEAYDVEHKVDKLSREYFGKPAGAY